MKIKKQSQAQGIADIRIFSNGSPEGTEVVDMASGNSLNSQIQEIRWTHKAQELPTVELVMTGVEIIVSGKIIAANDLLKPQLPPLRFIREDGKPSRKSSK